MHTEFRAGEYLPDAAAGRGCPIIVETVGESKLKRPCDRPAGHSGQHVATSYSGLILAVLGDPSAPAPSGPVIQIDDDTRDAARRIQSLVEEVLDALSNADLELSILRHKYRDNESVMTLVGAVRLPDEFDVESPLDTEVSAEEAIAEWMNR